MSDQTPIGNAPGPDRPPRSAEDDPAYQDWLATRDNPAPKYAADEPRPAADQLGAGPQHDPDYQRYLDERNARTAALADPEYAAWKQAKEAEAARVAALGPSCPHCHAPADNPSGEGLGYCWACGFGSHPEQAERYASATAREGDGA